jgi:hypothetical protein
MPYGTGACLPAKVGSGATTCPVAPDPAFPIRRAPAPHVYHGSGVPCVLQLWILPPSREGSGAPCILQLHILPPCKGGLWSATCPTAPDPSSLSGGLQCCHRMAYGFLWTAGLKHKENPSRPTCTARLACSQRMHACFQGA